MSYPNRPQPYAGRTPMWPARPEPVKPPKRPRRSFKARIQSLLAEGKTAPQIVDELGCYLSTVHRYQKPATDPLQGKIDRFNRRRPGYDLNKKWLADFTEWKCAVTGAKIDPETDSFCIGVLDDLPVVYLSKCRALAQAIGGLRAAGWTVSRPAR